MSPSDKPLTVAVLGAGGRIAPALVRDLAESSEVVNMRLLDIAGERATAVADSHGLGARRSHSTPGPMTWPRRSPIATCLPTARATG